MAAGDLVVADYQYEYNGLLMGAGTPFRIENIEGLLSMPDLGRNDTNRNDRHGAHSGKHTMEGREISFDLWAEGTEGAGAGVEGLLEQLGEVFFPDNILKPFVYRRPGTVKRTLLMKPTERDFDADYKVAFGTADGSVQLYAPDPFIYSLAEGSATTTLAIGATSGNLVVTNSGRVPSRKSRIVIGGPFTNPIIANAQDAARQVKLDLVANAAQTVTIDMDAWTVSLDGVDQTGSIRNDNEFWNLLKGANNLTYSRQAGNTGSTSTITVYWQQAWI